MKKLLLLILALGTLLQTQAQTDSISITPIDGANQDGNNQFVFGLNTNSVGFTYKRYFTNTFAMRIGVTATYIHTNSGGVTDQVSTINGVAQPQRDDAADTYSKETNRSNGVRLGLQKSFLVQKRLEPYVGFDLFYNTASVSRESSSVSYSGNSERTVTVNKSTPKKQALGAGVSTFVGFNYYIFSRVALGVEYSVIPFVYSNNGTNKYESTSTNTTTNVQSYFSSTIKGATVLPTILVEQYKLLHRLF